MRNDAILSEKFPL